MDSFFLFEFKVEKSTENDSFIHKEARIRSPLFLYFWFMTEQMCVLSKFPCYLYSFPYQFSLLDVPVVQLGAANKNNANISREPSVKPSVNRPGA